MLLWSYTVIVHNIIIYTLYIVNCKFSDGQKATTMSGLSIYLRMLSASNVATV